MSSADASLQDSHPGRATQILELDQAALEAHGANAGEDLNVSLRLSAGDVVMVHTTQPRQGSLLADACAGTVTPRRGHVRFLGRSWQAMDAHDTNAMRSLLGRVFFQGNWLDHLNMTENILLAQAHHTRRLWSDLTNEAAALARHFGLPGLPTGSPAQLDRAESQRAACVRAFLGAPRLIVLEHPTAGAFPQLLAPLVNAVRAACDRGAAVLWMTPSLQVWRDETIPVSRRLRVSRTTLVGGESSL